MLVCSAKIYFEKLEAVGLALLHHHSQLESWWKWCQSTFDMKVYQIFIGKVEAVEIHVSYGSSSRCMKLCQKWCSCILHIWTLGNDHSAVKLVKYAWLVRINFFVSHPLQMLSFQHALYDKVKDLEIGKNGLHLLIYRTRWIKVYVVLRTFLCFKVRYFGVFCSMSLESSAYAVSSWILIGFRYGFGLLITQGGNDAKVNNQVWCNLRPQSESIFNSKREA